MHRCYWSWLNNETCFYQLYGLTLSSELVCPELIPVENEGVQTPAVDIVASFASISEDGLEQPLKSHFFCQASEQTLWLNIDGLASFLIRDGKEILIDPVESDSTKGSGKVNNRSTEPIPYSGSS